MTFPLGSSNELIATAGQPIGGSHCLRVPAAVAAASGEKLTTTPTFRLNVVVHDSTTWSALAVVRSQPPPAQALRRCPCWILAVSLTCAPRVKPALQVPETACPWLMVQLMPLGVEYTVPFPLAPPDTVSVKLVEAGTKVAATSWSRSMVTWHTRCSSTLGWQVAPHTSSSLSTAPLAAVAVRLTMVPAG